MSFATTIVQNKTFFAVLIILSLLTCCILQSFSRFKNVTAIAVNSGDAFFSIMQITDTQYLSWLNSDLYLALTNWIVNNSDFYNLKMVVHTGDLVDTPTHTSEWEVANSAMLNLYKNGIPYCWNAGNHDQLPPNDTANLWLGDSNTDWLGSQYPAFNQTLMKGELYWVSDVYNGKNTAVSFSYLNYQILIINLEFLANNSALEWMRTLIRNHSNANVIVATHDYLNRTGGYGAHSVSNAGVLDHAWGHNLSAILDEYPNVFMTISGHILSKTTGASDKRTEFRQEIFFNRQELNDRTGGASVRIYSFDLSRMQVDVSTYALNLNTWQTDEDNHFSFAIDLKPNVISEIPYTSFLTSAVIVIVTIVLVIVLKKTKANLTKADFSA